MVLAGNNALLVNLDITVFLGYTDLLDSTGFLGFAGLVGLTGFLGFTGFLGLLVFWILLVLLKIRETQNYNCGRWIFQGENNFIW